MSLEIFAIKLWLSVLRFGVELSSLKMSKTGSGNVLKLSQ